MKLHRNELSSLTIYEIDQYCRKYNANIDELENLILEVLDREKEIFINDEVIQEIKDEAIEEMSDAKRDAYDEGYDDAVRERENGEEYIRREDHNQKIQEIIEKKDELIQSQYNNGYRDGWKTGTLWREPPKEILEAFPELKDV